MSEERQCVYCGHLMHTVTCMGTRSLLIGSEPCPCTSMNNEGPEQREPKQVKVNTGQFCDAPQVLPVSVRRCSTRNSPKDPKAIRLYEVEIDGAAVPVWLCARHMQAASRLSGLIVKTAA